MNKDKRWRLSDTAFCLSSTSVDLVKKLKDVERWKMVCGSEEAVVSIAKIAPYGLKEEYLCSVNTGVLFDLNGNCMSTHQLRLVEKTDEPLRPLAAPASIPFSLTISEKSPRGKGENRRFNTTEEKPENESMARAPRSTSVLNEVMVMRLRQRGANGKHLERITDIAMETGISKKTLSDARNGKTWTHLPAAEQHRHMSRGVGV